MRLYIKHDAKGNILSVAKANQSDDSHGHPFADVDENGGVLDVEEAGELTELECHDIHEQYKVDVKKKELKKKPSRSKTD